MWIASFYYQMALKTSASLFIFSCDIIGSKEKTENMQAVLEREESSAHIKRRSRDYRKRAEMWMMSWRLSGHTWTSEGTIASSNLEKKWSYRSASSKDFFFRCACNLSLFCRLSSNIQNTNNLFKRKGLS